MNINNSVGMLLVKIIEMPLITLKCYWRVSSRSQRLSVFHFFFLYNIFFFFFPVFFLGGDFC